MGMWFPTGEITVAVTVKVLRQQPGPAGNVESSAAAAGPEVQVV